MIILASKSPRRKDLLSRAGVEYKAITSDAEETRIDGESPREQAERLASLKANDVAKIHGLDLPVLGSDTIVVLDGKTLGKPIDRADGARMLKELAGRWHTVITGVSLIDTNGTEKIISVQSEVSFRNLSDYEIESYLDTGEPFDRAGSYAIQGIGAFIIDSLKGSYTNVIGLPLKETLEMLKEIEQ